MPGFDIAIIGGGPAGAVCAYLLEKNGFNCIIFDGKPDRAFKVGESLIAASKPLLSSIGLEEVFNTTRHQISHGNSSSWGMEQLYHLDSFHDPNGQGLHLDRRIFEADLLNQALKIGVTWQKAMVKSLLQREKSAHNNCGYWQITTQKNEVFRSTWLINASGRSNTIPRLLGCIPMHDDQLTSVHQWFKRSPSDCYSRTLIEASENGWWYTAPLPEHRRIISFQCDINLAEEIMEKPQLWLQEYKKTMHVSKLIPKLAKSRQLSPLKKSAASGGISPQIFDTKKAPWLATGDAALCFDPLSSQGIFNALYTGKKAAEAVISYQNGNTSGLEHYQTCIKNVRHAYMANHQQIYQSEMRWPNSSFWKYRQKTKYSG